LNDSDGEEEDIETTTSPLNPNYTSMTLKALGWGYTTDSRVQSDTMFTWQSKQDTQPVVLDVFAVEQAWKLLDVDTGISGLFIWNISI